MIITSANNFNDVKVEDVSHLGGMGCYLRLWVQPSHGQKLEKRLFGEYKPTFWARYVNDTFVIIDQDKISYYEELLNSIIPDLQFTMEEEVESKLSFLDVLICRRPDGKLATSVYIKPTNTLQMLSYNSNHQLRHKRSCVRTLQQRVETHCSTPAAKRNEMKLLQEPFRSNGHPRTLIERSRKQPNRRCPQARLNNPPASDAAKRPDP
nr:unnamed protein product [Spirometra erinaceieuropaei]